MSRRRQRLMQEANEIAGTASLACLLAGLLAGMVAAVALLQSVQFGPPVGELLQFGPYEGWKPVWQIAAERTQDGRRCLLQPAIMAASHGSIVVEQRMEDGPRFLLHWAGGPTSAGPTDCGTTANLVVRLNAMQMLLNANSAGRDWNFIGS